MKEFLDIRGIQRKYPDWRRRALEVEEREFLVGMSVVSETLSNMGEVGDIAEEYQFTNANQLSNPFMSGQAYMWICSLVSPGQFFFNRREREK